MTSVTLVGEAVIGEIVGHSLRDGLTGLYNHTYFFQQIDWEVRCYMRYGAPVSLILIGGTSCGKLTRTLSRSRGEGRCGALKSKRSGKNKVKVAEDC